MNHRQTEIVRQVGEVDTAGRDKFHPAKRRADGFKRFDAARGFGGEEFKEVQPFVEAMLISVGVITPGVMGMSWVRHQATTAGSKPGVTMN